MGGWDNAPEYGGPPKRWWDYAWPVALIMLIAIGIAYLLNAGAPGAR
jgi:hypothetical protein